MIKKFKQTLIKEDYKEWKENFYQKCIKDEYGKRYFINIEYYNMDLKNGLDFEGFEVKVQFQNVYYQGLLDNETTINLCFPVNKLNIYVIELIILRQWVALDRPYYEKNE